MVFRVAAQVPVLELDKDHAIVLGASGEAHPGDGSAGLYRLAFMLHKVIVDAAHHVLGLFHGGAGLQYHLCKQYALVFVRQITGGDIAQQIEHAADDKQIHHQETEHPCQTVAHHGDQQVPEAVEPGVKPVEKAVEQLEATFGNVLALGGRLEYAAAKHRGEDKGHADREGHGSDHGHGELAVDDAGGAAEEGHGAKESGEHQGEADERAGDLAHGAHGGLFYRQPLLVHQALDVLDHHDGVVNQQAYGDDHGEHGKHIDGETEDVKGGAGAQQHHWYSDGRDQGGAHIAAHKEPHDQEDQHDGLEKRLHRLLDGHHDKRSGVKGVDHLDAGGEVGAKLLHLALDGARRGQGIGARGLAYGQYGGGLAVEIDVDVIDIGAQFAAAHVADTHGGTAFGAAQRDVGKVLRGLE